MTISKILPILLFFSLACTNHRTTENSGDTRDDRRSDKIKTACSTPVCDGEPFMREGRPAPGKDWSKVQLQGAEETSLKSALSKTETSGSPDKLHLHADVINGHIVFSPDKDHDEHVSGSEPEVSLGTERPATKSLPVKVVATPAALKALQARSSVDSGQ